MKTIILAMIFFLKVNLSACSFDKQVDDCFFNNFEEDNGWHFAAFYNYLLENNLDGANESINLVIRDSSKHVDACLKKCDALFEELKINKENQINNVHSRAYLSVLKKMVLKINLHRGFLCDLGCKYENNEYLNNTLLKINYFNSLLKKSECYSMDREIIIFFSKFCDSLYQVTKSYLFLYWYVYLYLNKTEITLKLLELENTKFFDLMIKLYLDKMYNLVKSLKPDHHKVIAKCLGNLNQRYIEATKIKKEIK